MGDSWVELPRVLPFAHLAPKGGAPLYRVRKGGQSVRKKHAGLPGSHREQRRVGPRSPAFSLRLVGASEGPLSRGVTWLKPGV